MNMKKKFDKVINYITIKSLQSLVVLIDLPYNLV